MKPSSRCAPALPGSSSMARRTCSIASGRLPRGSSSIIWPASRSSVIERLTSSADGPEPQPANHRHIETTTVTYSRPARLAGSNVTPCKAPDLSAMTRCVNQIPQGSAVGLPTSLPRYGGLPRSTADFLLHPEEMIEAAQSFGIGQHDPFVDDAEISPIAQLLDDALHGVDVEPDAARELERREGEEHAFRAGFCALRHAEERVHDAGRVVAEHE